MILTDQLSPRTPDSSVSLVVPLPRAGSVSRTEDFLILYGTPYGEVDAIPQVLEVNSTTGTINDVTSLVFDGTPVAVANPRNVTLFADGSGGTYILIAEQGLDQSPWPGATDTLYDCTSNGSLIDDSDLLPTSLAYSHDASSGVINSSGDIGVFINNIYSEPDTPPYYLIENTSGHFTNVSNQYLPSIIRMNAAAFTSSLLDPLTSDGLSDLVIGSENLLASPSEVFLNPGNGKFSDVTPIDLPAPPLADTPGLYGSAETGPVTLDIQPIHILNSKYDDLVVVSTTANYDGWAIQILINNGSGSFTDQTATRLLAPSNSQSSGGAANGPWVVRTFIADIRGDGSPDIIVEGTNGAPNEVLLNNGAGYFSLAYTAPLNYQITGVCSLTDGVNLIETNGNIISFVPVATAYLAAEQTVLDPELPNKLYLYGDGEGSELASTLAASYDTTITLTVHSLFASGTNHSIGLNVNGLDLGTQSIQSVYGFTYQDQEYTTDQTLTFTLAGLNAINSLSLTQDANAGVYVSDIQVNGVDLGAVNDWYSNVDSVAASAWNAEINPNIGTASDPIQVTGNGPDVSAYVLGSPNEYSITGIGTGTIRLSESSGLDQNAILTHIALIDFQDGAVLNAETGGLVLIPKLAITSAGGLTDQTTQTISGMIDAADSGLTVSIYDGTTLIGTATPTASGSWSASVKLLSTPSKQSITAHAENASGNVGTSAAVSYILRPAPDDFKGDGKSDILIQNTSGAVVVGEDVGGALTYTQVAALGPEWSFVGNGDFLGQGSNDFLIENTAGAAVAGAVSGGATAYTQVAALGPEWKFLEAGDFLANGQDQFLIENTSGAVVLGNFAAGASHYTQVAALGPEWSFVGEGDLLGDGSDQFLIENTSGAVAVGDASSGTANYTQIASLGSEWSFKGVGDFLGNGQDQFLIENANGAVDIGNYSNGQEQYTQVAALGPEWKFIGVGDYLGAETAGVMIENASGAIVLGTITAGQAHFAQVGALGSEWHAHG